MLEINLDDLDVEAICAKHQSRLFPEEPSLDRAIHHTLGSKLELYLRRHNSYSIYNDARSSKNGYIKIMVSGSLDRNDLIRLADAAIIHSGVRFVFCKLGSNAFVSHDGDGDSSSYWIEIEFRPEGV